MIAVTLGLIWSTRLIPPPFTVTPAAGPMMLSSNAVLLITSWPAVKLIVCAVAKTLGEKLIK